MAKLYKVIRIDPTEGTIELAGEMNNGGFFSKGFPYSYIQEYINRDGDSRTAQGWVINQDGTIKIQQGGIYEAMYERKKDGQQYDTLKMIKIPETNAPPKPHPAQTVINQNAAKANSERDTAAIISAVYVGVNHVCEQLRRYAKGEEIENAKWPDYKEAVDLIFYAVDQDLRKSR